MHDAAPPKEAKCALCKGGGKLRAWVEVIIRETKDGPPLYFREGYEGEVQCPDCRGSGKA